MGYFTVIIISRFAVCQSISITVCAGNYIWRTALCLCGNSEASLALIVARIILRRAEYTANRAYRAIVFIQYFKCKSVFANKILKFISCREFAEHCCHILIHLRYLDCRQCLCFTTVCELFSTDCRERACLAVIGCECKIAVFIYNLAVYDIDIGIESLGCFGYLGCVRCFRRFGSTADLFTSSCTCACAVFAGIITCCEKILCDCIYLSYLLRCECIIINLRIYHCHALRLEVTADKSGCYVVTKAEIVVSAAYAGDKISCNAYFSVLFAVDINCAFLISCIIYTDYMNKLCYR